MFLKRVNDPVLCNYIQHFTMRSGVVLVVWIIQPGSSGSLSWCGYQIKKDLKDQSTFTIDMFGNYLVSNQWNIKLTLNLSARGLIFIHNKPIKTNKINE